MANDIGDAPQAWFARCVGQLPGAVKVSGEGYGAARTWSII
jgi:hypothetical protein